MLNPLDGWWPEERGWALSLGPREADRAICPALREEPDEVNRKLIFFSVGRNEVCGRWVIADNEGTYS